MTVSGPSGPAPVNTPVLTNSKVIMRAVRGLQSEE